MKKIVFLMFLFCFFLCGNTNAGIVTLDFDDLLGITDVSEATPAASIKDTFYHNVFLTTTTANYLFAIDSIGHGASSLPNSIVPTNGAGDFGNHTLKVIFPNVTDFVQITGGDSGGDEDSFTIEVYDSFDNLLDTSQTGIFGGNLSSNDHFGDSYTLSLSATGIKSALFISTSASGYGILWDDLTYSEVPIPGAVWLLVSGIVGLVGLRKKLKKRGHVSLLS